MSCAGYKNLYDEQCRLKAKYEEFVASCTTAKGALSGYANSLELVGLYCTNIRLTVDSIDNGKCQEYSAKIAEYEVALQTLIDEAKQEIIKCEALIAKYSGSCGSCSECYAAAAAAEAAMQETEK